MPPRSPKQPTRIETLRHAGDRRPVIPTAEFEAVMADDEKRPIPVAYPRNRDLDPQLVWRGKDEQDWSDLVVAAPPLYIQEKVHPKVLIDDLLRQSRERAAAGAPVQQLDLFADFNGLPAGASNTEFYKHDANWTNRMILGDSLQVMASLAEREGLRGKVQCIYLDPPYGIKFNSNFQWSTTSPSVKDGDRTQITREPEQVKAFRDTWRDGIHSYLTYLRDRLTVARDLLVDTGSIFVQIGDENVHRVRALLDEVFGDENAITTIMFQTSGSSSTKSLEQISDFVLWYGKDASKTKYRKLMSPRTSSKNYDKDFIFVESLDGSEQRRMTSSEIAHPSSIEGKYRRFRAVPCNSQQYSRTRTVTVRWSQKDFHPGADRHWSVEPHLFNRVGIANRLFAIGNSLMYKVYADEATFSPVKSIWLDTSLTGFGAEKIYVVQTSSKVIERCILMTTDPGDIVLDPTCGSGTTAYVAEQWGRRWITIDTSRVALALARARLMGARYPFYLLKDSPAGQRKEAEVTRTAPSSAPTYATIRQGFVYERVPRITLGAIANNAEIDVIWDKHQAILEPLRAKLNAALGKQWEEWEIPREAGAGWAPQAKEPHARWWEGRIARQREIDASIAAKAEFEYLYDRPYEDKGTVRVAGPFTVESVSPHRVLAVDEHDELIPADKFIKSGGAGYGEGYDFTQAILENLRAAGVQQAHKQDRISFTSLEAWPGRYISAEGRYLEGESGKERRAGIFVGPEFGTVPRADLVVAAREAGDAGFDVLIACAFSYDAHSAEFERLGRVPVLKARMNADLHMADTLKSTGAGNLFVIFGEPDIAIESAGSGQIRVTLRGVDVFRPQSGEVTSSSPDEIACWFIDTDYNEESFFVRHAYFLGAGDPYKSLKTTLKAEIDEEAWASLYGDTSRPFDKPHSGRIAVKVINHLGDEVMKVFSVSSR